VFFAAVPVTMPAPMGEMDVMPWAIFCRRGMVRSRVLASVVDATMRLRRLTGSAMWVARLASKSDTWLPPASGFAVQ
jgi:hypothetical protein